MADIPEISPQRQALAATLRDLRDAIGLDQREFARRAGWVQPKVSRIETGKTFPSERDIAIWVRVAGASEEALTDLVTLAGRAAAEVRDWKMLLGAGYGLAQQQVGELVQQASAVRSFQPTMVPGLLQAAEYARQALHVWDPQVSDQQAAEYVTARLRNQAILYDSSRTRTFEFVITEGSLRWRPGSVEALRAQIGYLKSMMTLANVRLGVIPFAAQAPIRYMHNFNIYESEDTTLVTIETFTGLLTVVSPGNVATHRAIFDRARTEALWGDEVLTFLDHLITELQTPSLDS